VKTATNNTLTGDTSIFTKNVINITQFKGYDTIQDAINNADGYDTILVGPGTYNIAETINIGKSITLKSLDGAANTIIKALNSGSMIGISEDDVTIEGFTFQGISVAMTRQSIEATDVNNIEVIDNIFEDTGSLYFTKVTDFAIQGNNHDGAIVQLWHCQNGKVEGNTGYDPGGTMYNYSSDYIEYKNNIVEANADEISDYGLSIQSSENVNVIGNLFTGFEGQYPYPNYSHGKQGAAIYINGSSGVIEGNTFADNTIGVSIRYLSGYEGEVVEVKGNCFTDNVYSIFNHCFERIDNIWTILPAKRDISAVENYWGTPDGLPNVVAIPEEGGKTWKAFWDIVGAEDFLGNAVTDHVSFS
jgi:hypothetical protein